MLDAANLTMLTKSALPASPEQFKKLPSAVMTAPPSDFADVSAASRATLPHSAITAMAVGVFSARFREELQQQNSSAPSLASSTAFSNSMLLCGTQSGLVWILDAQSLTPVHLIEVSY